MGLRNGTSSEGGGRTDHRTSTSARHSELSRSFKIRLLEQPGTLMPAVRIHFGEELTIQALCASVIDQGVSEEAAAELARKLTVANPCLDIPDFAPEHADLPEIKHRLEKKEPAAAWPQSFSSSAHAGSSVVETVIARSASPSRWSPSQLTYEPAPPGRKPPNPRVN